MGAPGVAAAPKGPCLLPRDAREDLTLGSSPLNRLPCLVSFPRCPRACAQVTGSRGTVRTPGPAGQPLTGVSFEEGAHSPHPPPPGETRGSGGCDLSLPTPPQCHIQSLLSVKHFCVGPRSPVSMLVSAPGTSSDCPILSNRGPRPLTLLRVRLESSLSSKRLSSVPSERGLSPHDLVSWVVQGGAHGPGWGVVRISRDGRGHMPGCLKLLVTAHWLRCCRGYPPLAERGPSYTPCSSASHSPSHLSPQGHIVASPHIVSHVTSLSLYVSLKEKRLLVASLNLCLPVLGIHCGSDASVFRVIINVLVLESHSYTFTVS